MSTPPTINRLIGDTLCTNFTVQKRDRQTKNIELFLLRDEVESPSHIICTTVIQEVGTIFEPP